MELEKFERRPWGKGRGKIVSNMREANHKETLECGEQTEGCWRGYGKGDGISG